MQPQSHVPPAPSSDFDLSLTRTLVPLRDMSEQHLLELLDHAEAETVFRGQVLFEAGSFDGCHVYLLFGEVSLTDGDGNYTQIKGGDTLLPIAHQQPRAVTATAETDCSVLRIDSEKLDKLLTWSEVADYLLLTISRQPDLDEDVDWMMTVLKSNLFFKVPPLNVDDIFARLEPMTVQNGDVILRQGEIGDRCYFIKEGSAVVTRNDGQGNRHLADITAGRCFGEDALVNKTVRNATVTMKTNGVLMTLDKQDFYRLLKEPQVAGVTLQNLDGAAAEGAVCVDVRGEEEYNTGHLPQAVNLPLNLLAIKSRLLTAEQRYIFYCDTGRRSRAAAHLLARQGIRALALENCRDLFTQARWRGTLERRNNYVLRDGRPALGD